MVTISKFDLEEFAKTADRVRRKAIEENRLRDNPSYEYISNHIGQLRNLLIKDRMLDDVIRNELRSILDDNSLIIPATMRVFADILDSYEEVNV